MDKEHGLRSQFEETKNQEILKNRFKQASVEEINTWFESTLIKITPKNSEIGMYRLFQLLIDEMPKKIPDEVHQIVLQAITTPDLNTQALGKQALVFLNARQLLSAVEYYSLSDRPEEKEDLLQEAISITLEKSTKLNKANFVTLIPGVRSGLVGYIAQKYGIPRPLIVTSAFKVLVGTIESVLGDGTRRLDMDEIPGLASALSQEAGVSETNLLDYLRYRTARGSVSTGNEPEEETLTTELKEIIENVLGTLKHREERILNSRYGLSYYGGARTLKEVGKAMGLLPESVRQTQVQALRKLRHPSRADKLRDFAQIFPSKTRNQEALMNGAVTAFCQGDYRRVKSNLAEIENIICAPLSAREQKIIYSLLDNPDSYRWSTGEINDFVDEQTKKEDKEIGSVNLMLIKIQIEGVVEQLRGVWKLRSKIPK